MFRRSRRPGLGLLLLAAQIFQVGASHIPPVTLAVIGLNVGIYLRLVRGLPSLGKACVSAHYVWFNNDWQRLALAAFYHLDDWHLYYNMVSFIWKGKSLEPAMGSARFLYVLAVFSLLTNALLVGLDLAFAHIFEDPSYIYTCAAGFSGVLFALKVITTYNQPTGVRRVLGIFPVPVRWAYWVELIVIQLLLPHVSFTGHLAGILVGLLYVKGPLKPIMDAIAGVGRPGAVGSRATPHYGPSYTYHAGTTGTRQNSEQQRNRRNSTDDEELQAAIRASLQETHRYPGPASYYHDNDPQVQSAIAESISRTPSGAQRGRPLTEAPPYPHSEGLYPRLPTEYSLDSSSVGSASGRPGSEGFLGSEHTRAPPPYAPSPSAPPEHGNLPYPTQNRMPTASIDEVRRRRLQRFER